MIDNRADIDPSARIADNVHIGPWTTIGPDVEIGEGTRIGSHTVINGITKIGKNNNIFQFSSIGEVPQDKKYHGEETILEIGDNNTIREYCTINRGSAQGGGATRIGDNNWLMAYVHVAHDSEIGNHTTFANCATLAGHVVVQDYASISAFSAVHQFCTVGAYSFVAKASYVCKDVLPYILVGGHSPSPCGLNTVGLKRNGFSSDAIENLRRAYKIIFRRGLAVQQAIEELQVLLENCPEVQRLISALGSSERGVVR